MARFQWKRVTKQSPCPVCKRPDWCRVSTDGTHAGCMRVETGCFRVKEGSDGSRVYLHRLAGAPRPEVNLPPRQGPEAQRADADTLHAVYSALLDRLQLVKSHREALHRRGLTDEAIARNGYRSLPGKGRLRIAGELRDRFGDKLLRVPGFIVKEGRSGRYLTLRGPAGLLVPCRDRAGRIVALKVRRDSESEGAPRYVYVSSKGHGGPGPGAPVHVPLGTPETAERVRLTEGELKADVVQALTGVPTVSIPGASSWRAAFPVLEALGCRTASLAFDADAPDNAHVARALADCAAAANARSLAVELERWDRADGKGIDDLLAAGKAPELLQGDAALQAVREILAVASGGEQTAPPDELARLQGVLDDGGAEALFGDKALLQALANLATADAAAFAAHRARLKGRVSLRDLDKALRPLRPPASPGAGDDLLPYFEQAGCVYRTTLTKDGPVTVTLGNFTARIVEDTVHDDGAEQTCSLAVEGTLANGRPLPRVQVPAVDFAGMNWVVPAWGTRAVVHAGLGIKDHLRAALQMLSGDVPRRTIYGHTGWRNVGGAWVYLHAGGAIGADGLAVDTAVSLPDPLVGFRLPVPPEGAELADAVHASLGLLRLGAKRVTFPLLAAVYRAAMGDTDFSLHLSGPTGCYKSEAAALAQQHYGAGMDARHLPASWSSTGNALEALAFAGKDALLVIDDFCPAGSVADVQRYHREADRLFRGQGNRSGRQRMRADASLRPSKPPRGLTLSTGEDTPRGQSLRARLLVLEVSPGDLGPLPPAHNPALTMCQGDATAGKYAAALAGFIRWLAPQYDALRGQLRGKLAELRDRARGDAQHARTPGIVADLALGLRYLLDFARCAGAISETERAEIWERGWAALTDAAAAQAAHLMAAEPAGLFMRLLSAVLASGCAHVAAANGEAPQEPLHWGWRPDESADGAGARFRAQGVRVGWLADGDLYLEPDASFMAVQRFASAQGESFAVTETTLRRRLRDKGLLASTDTGRGKLTVRRTLQSERRDVLHVVWTAPTAPAREAGDEDGPEPWAGP